MAKAKFRNPDSHHYSRLGRGRKKMLRWKKPDGRHNKLRQGLKSRGPYVQVGYGSPKSIKGKVKGKLPILVRNFKDFEKATKENIIIIGKIGMKKRNEIIKKAQEKGIEIRNLRKENKK